VQGVSPRRPNSLSYSPPNQCESIVTPVEMECIVTAMTRLSPVRSLTCSVASRCSKRTGAALESPKETVQ